MPTPAVADEEAAARRRPLSAHNRQSKIRTGDLVVDLETRVVTANGKPVRLAGKEYSILELLSRRKGVTVTKEMFLGHLYGGKDEPELKIIDVFVCHLRKKLAQATGGKHYIETVWGRGYRLRDPAEVPSLPVPDGPYQGGKPAVWDRPPALRTPARRGHASAKTGPRR